MKQSFDTAINWLCESNLRNKDKNLRSFGGINNGYNWQSKVYPFVYHEITGYAISSFLNMYRSLSDDKYLQYAKEAADYLLQFQVIEEYKIEYGAIPHSLGLPDLKESKQYWSFDNAMILQGLADLYLETKGERYYHGAIMIAKWLADKMQTESNSFLSMYDAVRNEIHHKGIAFEKDFGCLHAKHAIGLLKAAKISENDVFEKSAKKVADWVLSLQREDGAFWSNIHKKFVVTHSHCYAIEGLLYSYYILKDEKYLHDCMKGAYWLISRQYPDGALTVLAKDIMPRGTGRIERMFRSAKALKFTDETAQAVRIWLILHNITDNNKYLEAAEKAIRFLKSVQSLESEDINMKGGFYYKIDDTFSRHKSRMMYTWCSQFCLDAFDLFQNRKLPNFYDYSLKSLF